MKKLAAVIVVAFATSFTMASCGTEQDDSIGIDQMDNQDEEALLIQYQCVVVNGVLNGWGLRISKACTQVQNTTKCPVGATPLKPGFNALCSLNIDMGRTFAQ